MKVTADGTGVVSHAGTELLREMAELTGLVDAWDDVLLDTYKTFPTVDLENPQFPLRDRHFSASGPTSTRHPVQQRG